jgi:hypothetical protein
MKARSWRTLPTKVVTLPIGHSGRPEAERFIQQCYQRAYGAEIRDFLPVLLGLYDADDQLLATLGFQLASEGPLFLEQYLDQPIDLLLHRQIKKTVQRHQIVEIGNLAAMHPGGAQWLFLVFNAYLHAADYQWAAATLVPTLINGFHKLGMSPLTLAQANPGRLHQGTTDWGSYYSHQPKVMAGHIAAGFEQLNARLQVHGALNQLWRNAYAAGQRVMV